MLKIVILSMVVQASALSFAVSYKVVCKTSLNERVIELNNLKNYEPIADLKNCKNELEVYRYVKWLPKSMSRWFFSRVNFIQDPTSQIWYQRTYSALGLWVSSGLSFATSAVAGSIAVATLGNGNGNQGSYMPPSSASEGENKEGKPKTVPSSVPVIRVQKETPRPATLRPVESSIPPDSPKKPPHVISPISAVGGLPNFASEEGLGNNVCWLNSMIKFLWGTSLHDEGFRNWLYNHSYNNHDDQALSGHLRDLIETLSVVSNPGEMVRFVDEVVKDIRRGRADEAGDQNDWLLSAGDRQMDGAEMLGHFFDRLNFTPFEYQKKYIFRDSLTTDLVPILPLPLPKRDASGRFPIQEAIDDFFAKETAPATESNPTDLEVIEKSLDAAPSIIILSVKRFTGDNREVRERIKGALANYERIELPLSNGEVARYRLVATINHSGALNGGHYTASVLENNVVFNHNDRIVTPSSWQAQEENFYILSYRRIDR